MSALGPKPKVALLLPDFRFAPINGHRETQ
jgi:hypothetical protein